MGQAVVVRVAMHLYHTMLYVVLLGNAHIVSYTLDETVNTVKDTFSFTLF